ncbi:hypothetical protein [Spirosoma fluviale]|uniref:Lipoprotein n=1 Tax=Spirosoma fluviale TaxID=1597977 RepID=A0A286GR44_9BACT|nr:hypothetical protein [Spirosoma fluviale]SOD97972.1 hypothetical protein SAMN06269250_5983 [Spirosoma fluviale]
MLTTTVKYELILTGSILSLFACQIPAHQVRDQVYQYQLVAEQSLECYLSEPPDGARKANIPVGDTITAESASYLTGIPAYSKVVHQQKEVWVFGALSKTRVVSKKKVMPAYRKNLPEVVIFKRPE